MGQQSETDKSITIVPKVQGIEWMHLLGKKPLVFTKGVAVLLGQALVGGGLSITDRQSVLQLEHHITAAVVRAEQLPAVRSGVVLEACDGEVQRVSIFLSSNSFAGNACGNQRRR